MNEKFHLFVWIETKAKAVRNKRVVPLMQQHPPHLSISPVNRKNVYQIPSSKLLKKSEQQTNSRPAYSTCLKSSYLPDN